MVKRKEQKERKEKEVILIRDLAPKKRIRGGSGAGKRVFGESESHARNESDDLREDRPKSKEKKW
jgi:hypothetical protein